MQITPQEYKTKYGELAPIPDLVSPSTSILKSQNNKIIKRIRFTNLEDFKQWFPCLKNEIQRQNDQWAASPNQVLKILNYTYTNSITENLFYITYDCNIQTHSIFSKLQPLNIEHKFKIALKILEIGIMIKNTSVCHHNIKPSNLLIHGNDVLLTDYGSTRTHYRNYVKTYPRRNDLQWQSYFLSYQCKEYLAIMSEQVELRDRDWERQFEQDNVFADIWALGIIILQLYLQSDMNQYLSSFYGLNRDLLKIQLQRLEDARVAQALDALLLNNVDIMEVYQQLQGGTPRQVSQFFSLRQSQIFYPPKYLYISQAKLNEIKEQKIVEQQIEPSHLQINLNDQQEPTDPEINTKVRSEETKGLIFNFTDINQIEIEPVEPQQPEPDFVHYASLKLLSKSYEILNQIHGKNYYLHKFLTHSGEIQFIEFENLKQLTFEEIQEYINKLNVKQQVYEDELIKLVGQRRDLKIKQINQIKFHIFQATSRLRALEMLQGNQLQSETNLLYYLNQQELDQFIPQAKEAKRFNQKIQEINLLNNNLKNNFNANKLENFGLQRLQNLKCALNNCSRGMNRIQLLEQINIVDKVIMKIEDEIGKQLFQKFQFCYELEKETLCKRKCNQFLDTLNKQYLLTSEEFEVIKQWHLAEKYLLKLFEGREMYFYELNKILYSYKKIDSPSFKYLQSKNRLIDQFFLNKSNPWNEKIPSNLGIYLHHFDVFEEEYERIDQTKIYKGYKFLGKPHGLGVMINNEAIYQGIFDQGKFLWGVIIEQVGTKWKPLIRKYTGYLSPDNQEKHDKQCTFEIHDQNLVEKYVGEMQNGQVTGRGKKTYYVNGQEQKIYEGEWNNDKKQGYGRMKNSQAYLPYDEYGYEGQFENDQRNGQGKVYLQADGQLYREGTFENGKPIGIHVDHQNGEEVNRVEYKYFLGCKYSP